MFADIIGVVKTVNEVTTIIGKASQKEVKKREINLVDDSRVQVRLTLWGDEVGYSCICLTIK
jgi:replication factor A1